MKNRLTSLLVVVSLLFLLVVPTAVWAGNTKMPPFALEDVRNGKIVDSSSFAGKVLLLTFFATWCPPCAEEVPVLKTLHKDLSGAGFSVVGLSVDQQGAPIVARFVEKKGINYPVLLAETQTTMDFGGVYNIPVAFLINKSGNVVKKYLGFIQHGVLEKDVRSLLE
jgi:peroxiredoxin